jgi:hypothetical protein
MNCHYSNLIEGHNTTPREIEAALQVRLEAAEERRNLQLEARAHIRLQREIDRRHAAGDRPDPASVGFIAFMAHFETRYRLAPLGPGSRIMALTVGIGAHGLWFVSHGLARGLEIRGEYKRMMDHAAMPRQGDLDGRGNLSHRGLTGLFAFDTLVDRLRLYAERHAWRSEAWLLLERALQQGEVYPPAEPFNYPQMERGRIQIVARRESHVIPCAAPIRERCDGRGWGCVA